MNIDNKPDKLGGDLLETPREEVPARGDLNRLPSNPHLNINNYFESFTQSRDKDEEGEGDDGIFF
jgi:hypothetical protein